MELTKESLTKLVHTVYSNWLEEAYGISKSPTKATGCELKKERLKFKIVQDQYQPKFEF